MVLAFCHFFLQNRPTIAAGLVGTGSSILQFLTRREYYDLFKNMLPEAVSGDWCLEPHYPDFCAKYKEIQKYWVVLQHTTGPLKFFGRHGIPDGTVFPGQPVHCRFFGQNTNPLNCTVFSRLKEQFWRNNPLQEEFCQELALLPLEIFTVVSGITALRRRQIPCDCSALWG
jgi:hypothetical protein